MEDDFKGLIQFLNKTDTKNGLGAVLQNRHKKNGKKITCAHGFFIKSQCESCTRVRCTLCEKSYCNKSYLIAHMQKHYKEEEVKKTNQQA